MYISNADLYIKEIREYGKDILLSDGMNKEKEFAHHGNFSVYHHSLNVAFLCLHLATFLKINCDRSALVKGALLHDYFLYDWHDKPYGRFLHGFLHPYIALNNAIKDFHLNEIEKNMIMTHMFPLTIIPPANREAIILCLADKIAATYELIATNKQFKNLRTFVTE